MMNASHPDHLKEGTRSVELALQPLAPMVGRDKVKANFVGIRPQRPLSSLLDSLWHWRRRKARHRTSQLGTAASRKKQLGQKDIV